MEDSKLETVIDNYLESVCSDIKEMGGLNPQISFIADHIDPDEDTYAIVHVPIPPELMKTDESKEFLLSNVLPKIIEKAQEKFVIMGVCFSSEAWVRKTVDKSNLPDNWKDLPIEKEIVIITVQTQKLDLTKIYDIDRTGKVINEEGDLIDDITLTLNTDMSNDDKSSSGGVFSNLYHRYIKN